MKACVPRALQSPRVGRLRRLYQDTNAVITIETAFIGPILLLLGIGGFELANLVITYLRINQAAVHIADNSSRIGERSQLAAQQIFERDINDLFIGVDLQAGEAMQLYQHGRVVLSSLQRNSDGGQWIRWQRCMGRKLFVSAYGAEDRGRTGTGFPGMGPAGQELRAPAGGAVMFVEISYTYQPVIANHFTRSITQPFEIRSQAAFIVRNNRDLSELYRGDLAIPQYTCNRFETI